MAVGGGVVGLVVVALLVLLQGGGLGDVVNAIGGGGDSANQVQPEQLDDLGECTVEQANTQRDCRLSATAYALDAYWTTELAAYDVELPEPGVTSFEGSVDTGCGAATSAVGPFYCPPDQRIYLDLGFYDELQSQFGATDGPLAEVYVTAHEYGHHVQNITGYMQQADRGGTGAEGGSVRLELQADCFAGMFIGNAATTKRPGTDTTFMAPVTEQQLQNALDAAAGVGDDRIQQQATGSINPDTWTHGSSAQRQHWFTVGYEKRDIQACDTFTATDLG